MSLLQIFFSHNTRDREWCEGLRESARPLGIDVYLAEHDNQPGRNLAEKVTKALDTSHAVVVLISANSVSAPYVNQEIGYALKAKKLIIPLVQSGIAVDELAMLQGIEYIPFDFDNPHDGQMQLMEALKHLLSKQVSKDSQKNASLLALGVLGMILIARRLGPIEEAV